ncbi:glycogen-binding domain-containing protein [Halalkalibaculum sp. DA3122]|uniref:glycogen-binding domain-containing protein n=1 Tax=Halalkalibaculum sp. DA3122 TaxID=3373607 RepID=UPI003754F0D0
MRIIFLAMAVLFFIAGRAHAQQWQTVLYFDSRVGFSSNTYLNPYFSEWDRSVESGYGTVSLMGQTAWFDEKNVAEFTGNAVWEPYFGNDDTWKGFLGMANYRRSLSDNLTGGIETGGSYFSSSFSRTLWWAQPALSWHITPFSSLRIKAGTSYRQYDNYVVDSTRVNSQDQTGIYAVEFETWPSFRWQLSAGLYGSLETLPSVGEGFRSTVSAARLFEGGTQLRLTAGLEQYQNEFTATAPDGGSGFPPVGGSAGGSETVEKTNRLFRLGIEGSYPVSNRISLFLNAEGLHYQSGASAGSLRDLQVAGGVRLSFEPDRRSGGRRIEPEWQNSASRQHVYIRYAGEGQLYLVGDFNNWERPGIPLVEQENNRYMAELSLETGAYEYKVLKVLGEEEEWISFSDNVYTVNDGFDGTNAMLLIEQ